MAKTKPLSQLLKQAREKAELSQKNIADALGYQSAQFISNWERGISTPPVKTLKRLGELCKVSPNELYESLVADTLTRIEADLHREFYGAKAKTTSRRR